MGCAVDVSLEMCLGAFDNVPDPIDRTADCAPRPELQVSGHREDRGKEYHLKDRSPNYSESHTNGLCAPPHLSSDSASRKLFD